MWWILVLGALVAALFLFLAEMSVDAQASLFRRNPEGKYTGVQRVIQTVLIVTVAAVLCWAVWVCYTQLANR